MKYFPLILLGVLLNAAAQILLKRGMTDVGTIAFQWKDIYQSLPKIVTSIPVLGGFACYAFSVIVWLGVLNRVEVSFAYPMLSIGYIVVLFYGFLFLQEQVNASRLIGVLCICVGVFFLFRSS